MSNNFKLAYRNLARNSRYLLINVIGLGIALSFCILSGLNYRFAHSYDRFHHDPDQVVRVETIKASNNEPHGISPSALGPAVVADLSGVEAMCRYDSRFAVVKFDEKVFNENLHFADENFFQFFDFEAVIGKPDITDQSKVCISQDVAEKYFGKEDPIGKVLVFYADGDVKLPLMVNAVFKNIPLNSSLRFNFLTHFNNQYDGAKRVDYNNWKYMVDATFFRLKKDFSIPQLSDGLRNYVAQRNTAAPDWTITGYRLEPLLEISYNSRFLRANGLWMGMPPAAVWGNFTLAIMILLTAALNFANMTISICNRRLREVGVRKVMGSSRWSLMRQMLGETLLVVALAAVLGMVLAYPVVEWFNSTWKFTDLKVDYSDPITLSGIGVVIAFTTLLAGSYPAFYISAFQPIHIFRGGVLFGGSNLFSRFMMGMQLAISLMAVIVGVSFANNSEQNRTADIGYQYQPILQAWLPNPSDYRRFENEIKNIPGVVATSGSIHLPGFGFDMVDIKVKDQLEESLLYNVGNNFFQIMDMKLSEGAWPIPAADTTASPEVVVNQTFIREIGIGIGSEIEVKKKKYVISGIVTDFMTRNPFNPISPAILHPIPEREYRRCIIKTASTAQQPAVLAAIEEKWKTMFPYSPFNVGYQSEAIREATEASDSIAESMVGFAMVAIILCITGLFSLVSLNILRRLRELAIRRVMGASAGNVTWILNKNYIGIFAGAILLGCGMGYVFAIKLMDSIFKINYGVPMKVLVVSAVGILLVAFCTVGLKIWQTLKVNPAEVLRS